MSFFSRTGLVRVVEGGAFVASNAIVTGDLDLGRDVNVWFGCVLRGDDAPIVIGARTNIQDLTMVHADPGVPNRIGVEVTVGHRCVLHGAEVGDRCLIGMGAILLGGSRIGAESIVAAGAVVKENMHVPPRSLVVGVPARIAREVSAEEVAMIAASAEGYVRKARLYLVQDAGEDD
jgi:carbonic anhydrase/acetyltransferase-like protein (isoleucine patch superfamily)